MDIATIVGFILAYFIISTAIMLGGSFNIFVNAPSLLIVVGGTFAVTLMRVTLANFPGSFKIGLKGFFYNLDAPQNLIDESVELANVARKEGILALEGREIGNGFLERGISLYIDGHAPEVVKGLLADNEPIVPNDSWENRAKNRRVEISVLHGNRHAIAGESPASNVDYVGQTDN